MLKILISRRRYINSDKIYSDSSVSRLPVSPVSAAGLLMPSQIRYICFGIRLATMVFAGRFFDTSIVDEVVTVGPGTMTSKVVF
jgi:hypothetical protein